MIDPNSIHPISLYKRIADALDVPDCVENLNAVIENILGLRRTKDIVIARPGTGD